MDISPHVRSCLKDYFETRGATVYVIDHIEKIVPVITGQIHSGTHLDLIFGDIRLNGGFGFITLKLIREALHGQDTPVVVTSWGFGGFAIEQMARWGARAYLEKPYSLTQLDLFLAECRKENAA